VFPRTGTDGFEKRTSLNAAIRNLDGPARSLVSIPTMQSQQFYVPLTVSKKYHSELRQGRRTFIKTCCFTNVLMILG